MHAVVIIRPAVGIQVKKRIFSKKSLSAENESLNLTLFLYTLRKDIAYIKTLPITIPYLKTLPNALVFRPKPKSSRQPIRIEHKKPLNFVNQSESSVTTPKNTRELSARVEVPSRLWAQVGSHIRMRADYSVGCNRFQDFLLPILVHFLKAFFSFLLRGSFLLQS